MTPHIEAERLYKNSSPLHGSSTQHKEDLANIKQAAQPCALAEQLIAQRKTDVIDRDILEMLRDQQGSRKRRFVYDQEAVIGLEHLQRDPLDPVTQVPIWKEMLVATRGGKTLAKGAFHKKARAILCQTSLYKEDL